MNPLDIVVWISWSLVVAIVVFLFKLRFLKSRTRFLLEKIPSPDSNFIFGHVLTFYAPRDVWFKKAYTIFKDFYPISVIWSGRSPRVTLMRARAAEKLLSTTQNLDKAAMYRYLTPWLGFGLLTSTGSKWHSRRKLITPTFHFRILEDFFGVIREQANVLVQTLLENSGKEAFDVCPYLTRCTLDVICETAMGKAIHCQQNAELGSKYLKSINSIAEIILYRSMYPWLQIEWLFSWTSYSKQQKKDLHFLNSFTEKVIHERRDAFNTKKLQSKSTEDAPREDTVFGGKRRLAFLDMLIESTSESGQVLMDSDILEEVNTFMFEGHDTTASGLSWILFNVGQFPEVQKKIQEELDEIFGDSDRDITWADLSELKYLERVIKESLRLYPPVPIFGRTLSEDTEISGYLIPRGVSVSVNAFILHRDPEFFPDPEKFDPDRFLTENCVNRHPYAYIPFSAGPRNCIGQRFALMEEKVVVATLLRKFKVTSMQKFEEIDVTAELILRPAQGMWMKFQNRK